MALSELLKYSPTAKAIRAMGHINDIEIIKRCQQGDEDAFRELVKRYQEKVVWIGYQMVGNYEDAKDISQEAFLRVYRSIGSFNLMSNFYTWMYRIVVNLCIDFLRKQKNKIFSFEEVGEKESGNLSPEQIVIHKEDSLKIHKVLQMLPYSYRSILILRDIEGFSCKEIAKIIGCNSNTVRWRLFRARQIFQKFWKQEKDVQSDMDNPGRKIPLRKK